MSINTSAHRILFLHGSSDLYGASRVLLQTVIACKQQGFHIVVVLSEKGPLFDQLTALAIPVHIIRLGILRRKYNNIGGLINRVFFWGKAFFLLKKIIKNDSINTIYSNTTAVFVGAITSRLLRVRHIWHIHEIIKEPRFLLQILSYFMEYFSDISIAVSSATFNHWSSINPNLVKKHKLVTIFNGIDAKPYSAFGPSLTHPLVIGMIGRVHFWKGQSYFLEIAHELNLVNPHIEFIMAGDAFKGYEYLLKEIALKKIELGLEQHIKDLGYVSDNTEFFRRIDLLIVPSILPDPLPTVVLEAMASAKPVAATNIGGALDMIIDDETGLLIPWNDAKKAANKIQELIDNPDLMLSMGEKGRSRALEYFSIDRYHSQIIELIESI